MNDATTRSAWRVRAYVLIGVALGVTYAAIDAFLDRAASGRLLPLATFSHHVVDRVIPIVAGALAGIAVHYVQVRSALARAQTQRADELQHRLQRIERDQAVWVVAAATLHEVKNPMHAIGLLLDEVSALPPGSAVERDVLMRKARAQIERANASLASLRALARNARPDCSVVAIDQLATELAAEMSAIAERDGLRIHVDAAPARAKSDPSFVRIILENLIANSLDALRQRGGEGEVAIEVTTAGSNAVVRVRDDGPGIDPSDEGDVFEPLATSKAHGLGLGLSIARALARTMQGELACVREPGWAATFELRLPRAA
jgi:signal transduction histidine kinase